MIGSEEVEQLKELLAQSQSVFVVFGAGASLDHKAVAVALHRALTAAGKEVLLISPAKLSEKDTSELLGLESLTTEIGNQNLSVSFPYDESAVDKVSYHIGEETKRFYLTIKPKKGVRPLDSTQVDFSYTGAETDLIFLIGVSKLESLADVYVGYEDLYASKPVVTVNSFSPDFGNVHLDTSGTPSMSEAIVKVLRDLEMTIDGDSATNLLSAIEAVTKHFQSLSTTADTFETVAHLLRLGARRVRLAGQRLETEVPIENGTVQRVPKQLAKSEKKLQRERPANPSAKPGSLSYQPNSDLVGS